MWRRAVKSVIVVFLLWVLILTTFDRNDSENLRIRRGIECKFFSRVAEMGSGRAQIPDSAAGYLLGLADSFWCHHATCAHIMILPVVVIQHTNTDLFAGAWGLNKFAVA